MSDSQSQFRRRSHLGSSDDPEQKADGVGPVREVWIKKSLCCLARYGVIASTVPPFDGYMTRWIPSLPAR